MAQRHEIEAWVNPSAWDDPSDAQRVIDQIMATGSDDEVVWVGIVADHDGLSDTDRAEVTLTALAGQISDDRSQLRDLAVDAVRSGVLSEVRAAAAAGVSRPTIRSWLGK